MTSTEMLARVRTALDEAATGFNTDAEIYSALADGQNAVINVILSIYKAKIKVDNLTELPYELITLLENATASITASFIALPTGFLYLVNAKWDHDATGGQKPCLLVSNDKMLYAGEDNSYLAATSTSPKAYVATLAGGSPAIHFLPTYSTSGVYTISYIKTPTAIASGQNPLLPVSTHSAIVFYATAQMFIKDEKIQEAQSMLNDYSKELSNLIR
jgi:hypothetical protein